MSDQNDTKNYRRLRKAIGGLGFALPALLLIFSLIPFFETPFQHSISHYYYTNLREMFTGALCAVGLFLVSYQGQANQEGSRSPWWKNDNLLTNISGVMALGVAFVPTNAEKDVEKVYTLIPWSNNLIGWFHYGFAAILFIAFAIMSIYAFTIGQKDNEDIPVSVINENHIYKACGYAIFVCIALVPVCAVLKISSYSTLVLEALSLFAFGISWLVKGRALGDKGVIGQKVYREFNA